MSTPLLILWNKHYPSCGDPPAFTNKTGDKYIGYFQNRFGEQWVFVYDPVSKKGELRGGDISWDQVVPVEEGRVDLKLSEQEALWLEACWRAASEMR